MFRRRPFRRPHPPLVPGAPPGVGPVVREALARAHNALERGDALRAAHIFRQLAEEFAHRRMPLRAAGMLLEAACAETQGDRPAEAVADGRRALEMLAHLPLPGRIAATAERLATTLHQRGHNAQAAEIEHALEEALQRSGISRQEVTTHLKAARLGRHGLLPAKCASCGGPILPDEVEWHSPDTAECPYCGSVLHAQ